MRQDDDAFAERWAQPLDLGVERLQDNAMNRALNGTPKPVWRNGQQVGSVQQYDNRLLQFLLRSHRPEIYGDRKKAGLSPLPFDLAKHLAAAAIRADAYDAHRAAEKRRTESNKKGADIGNDDDN